MPFGSKKGWMPSLRSCYRKLGAQLAHVHPKPCEAGLHHPNAHTEAITTSNRGGYIALSQYLEPAPGGTEETRCSTPLHLLAKHPLSHSTVFPQQLGDLLQSLEPRGMEGSWKHRPSSLLGMVASELLSHARDVSETPGKEKLQREQSTHIPEPGDIGAPPTSSGAQSTREWKFLNSVIMQKKKRIKKKGHSWY